MGIYLAHDHKMLKQDAAVKPGKYFGWIESSPPPGLLYLTYFRNDFLNSGTSLDYPVVRDPSIPYMPGASNSSRRALATVGSVDTQNEDGINSEFSSFPCAVFSYQNVRGNNSISEWNLPFTSASKFTMTFRVYFNTNSYINCNIPNGFFRLNPSIGFNDNAEVSDFFSTKYPHTVLLGGYSTEADPRSYPSDFPNVDLYNGTTYTSWDDKNAQLPPGRLFHAFGNTSSSISPYDGDQWYYVMFVGYGNGYMGTYVNGTKVLEYPFETLSSVAFYVGAEDIPLATQVTVTGNPVMKVTELAIWDGDISNKIKNKTNPIYVKKGDIWIPNPNY